VLEEGAADPAPLRLGLDVEVVQLTVAERGEAEDAAVLLPDPHLLLLERGREEAPVLLRRVQRGEERERAERAAEERRHRLDVVGPRASEHVRTLRRTLEPVRARDEPVRLTRIYTRTGDAGETALGDLSRVPKTHPRVEAFGAVDELNAHLGLALAAGLGEEARGVLVRVQNELFDLGADLSRPGTDGLRVTQAQVDALERDCDRCNEALEPLRSFVLPGGSEAAARLHVARTVCRRAEREALRASAQEELSAPALVYLNRLSDLLFILARAANAGGEEPLWRPGASRGA
jgi:cob(I)alamin adenosyltransferase